MIERIGYKLYSCAIFDYWFCRISGHRGHYQGTIFLLQTATNRNVSTRSLAQNRVFLHISIRFATFQNQFALFGVVEAVGSSPVTPTSRKARKHAVYELFPFLGLCLKTRLGHHRGHHVQNDGKSSRFLGLANHISVRFQRFADVCLNLCLAHLGSCHSSLIYSHGRFLSVLFSPYSEYRIRQSNPYFKMIKGCRYVPAAFCILCNRPI